MSAASQDDEESPAAATAAAALAGVSAASPSNGEETPPPALRVSLAESPSPAHCPRGLAFHGPAAGCTLTCHVRYPYPHRVGPIFPVCEHTASTMRMRRSRRALEHTLRGAFGYSSGIPWGCRGVASPHKHRRRSEANAALESSPSIPAASECIVVSRHSGPVIGNASQPRGGSHLLRSIPPL